MGVRGADPSASGGACEYRYRGVASIRPDVLRLSSTKSGADDPSRICGLRLFGPPSGDSSFHPVPELLTVSGYSLSEGAQKSGRCTPEPSHDWKSIPCGRQMFLDHIMGAPWADVTLSELLLRNMIPFRRPSFPHLRGMRIR